jgi:hypothetical protein
MDFNGLAFNGARWTAVLAPIGVMSDDGRALSDDFHLRLEAVSFPMALHSELPVAAIIGTVDLAGINDSGQLVAGGTVVDVAAAIAMDSGELRPQMHLDAVTFDDDAGTVAGGTLRQVVAGKAPAWPVCRFTITGPL